MHVPKSARTGVAGVHRLRIAFVNRVGIDVWLRSALIALTVAI